jgi:hypothetical protein
MVNDKNVSANVVHADHWPPVRPNHNWKSGDHLGAYPVSTTVRHRPVDSRLHQHFTEAIKSIPPGLR